MINNSVSISFGRLAFDRRAGARVFDEYSTFSPASSIYRVMVKDYPDEGCFDIFVKGADNKNLGGSSFVIDKKLNKLSNISMAVSHNSNKNKGIGTILHLSHIMEMVENGLNSIEFYSTKEAVLFHSKLGFYPDIKTLFDLDVALSSMVQNKSGYAKNLVKKAKSMRKKLKNSDNQDIVQNFSLYKNFLNKLQNIENGDKIQDNSSNLQTKKMLKKGNRLIAQYIDLCIKNSVKDTFLYGFCMQLSSRKVAANKNFYNKLFKNYKIDYHL